MKTKIILPLPFDDWNTFKPFIERFVKTFKQFSPGCDYELIAMSCWREPTDEERDFRRQRLAQPRQFALQPRIVLGID